jgi:AbrB family looped-hinge helix DNA binding protein
MKAKVTLDKAGRVTLPKKLREAWHLVPGDLIQLKSEGGEITLRPLRRKAPLTNEQGVWVYQGEPTHASIPDLIDRQRKKRLSRKNPKG